MANINQTKQYSWVFDFAGAFVEEIYASLRNRLVPLHILLPASAVLVIYLRTEGLGLGLPFSHANVLYLVIATLIPFFFWLLVKAGQRFHKQKHIRHIFENAGIRNSLKQCPKLLSDKNLDKDTKMIKFASRNIPMAKFQSGKEFLEAGLRIYVDDIRENRNRGTVDIIYSKKAMPNIIELEDFSLKRDEFIVGHTRSKKVTEVFRDVPHLLVAGQTGGGKSTFLRQLICTTYLNNSKYKFTAIDLKGGLEFQLFEEMPRIDVISTSRESAETLSELVELMTHRQSVLKKHKCKDIDALRKLKNDMRKKGKQEESKKLDMDRHIVVIDEIAELFLNNSDAEEKANAQESRRLVSKIARLGRASGIHLVVGTQRPDARAVDPQIKANLVGKLCFSMGDIHSSMVILGNARAKYLPNIPGRAIWQAGMQQVEVQVPHLDANQCVEKMQAT